MKLPEVALLLMFCFFFTFFVYVWMSGACWLSNVTRVCTQLGGMACSSDIAYLHEGGGNFWSKCLVFECQVHSHGRGCFRFLSPGFLAVGHVGLTCLDCWLSGADALKNRNRFGRFQFVKEPCWLLPVSLNHLVLCSYVQPFVDNYWLWEMAKRVLRNFTMGCCTEH